MAMREVDIFQMALGLTPPWEGVSCEFSPELNFLTWAFGAKKSNNLVKIMQF